MNVTARRAAVGTMVALLGIPAFALAAHPRTGHAFTSTKADIHVSRSGTRIRDAQINCKQRNGGLTLQSIEFQRIPIKRSGFFTYHGTAFYGYFTGNGYRGRSTTATLKGKFDSSTHVKGTVTGGPHACRSVRFTATYNPSAH